MVQRHTDGSTSLSRRTVLGWGALGAAGAGLAGALGVQGLRRDPASRPETQPARRVPPANVAAWRASGPPFYIAHRGAGIVVPEHSLEAYRAALAWGATCLEISVGMTSDGVLICMHDATYDRTTTLRGPVAAQSSKVLATARIDVPRLGPRWQGRGRPRIPLLTDVLREIGPQAILCLEAKDDRAFEPMMAAARAAGLSDRIYAKLHLPATARVAQARAAKVPIFMYAGTSADLAPARLDLVLAGLDPARDVIVLPAVVDDAPIDPALVSRVVARGVPVWLYPVMRRSEAAGFLSLGAQGIITPDIGYVSGTTATARADAWATGALASGELTRFPYSTKFGLRWGDPAREKGVIRLDVPGESTYLLLGHLGPVAPRGGSYRIEVDYRFDDPGAGEHAFTLVFGRADDRYVGPTPAGGTGYRARVRPDGSMRLLADDGSTRQRTLASAQGGRHTGWTRLAVEVSPGGLRVSRDGVTVLTSTDAAYRGGYLHVGRDGTRGPVALRRLQVIAGGVAAVASGPTEGDR